MAGFDEAGGLKGSGWTSCRHDRRARTAALSAEYFKKAGYASGKYEGNEEDPDGRRQRGRRAPRSPRSRRATSRSSASRSRCGWWSSRRCTRSYCNVPAGEGRGVPERRLAQGLRRRRRRCWTRRSTARTSSRQGNSNWSQLDDPAINKAMDEAEILRQADQRAAAWAAIDKMVTAQAPADPVHLGQDPADRVRGRQRRRVAGKRAVGPRLDVAEVGAAALRAR